MKKEKILSVRSAIVANSLYDSWLAKYLKKMEWYDASDNSTEDILKEIKDFDTQYGK